MKQETFENAHQAEWEAFEALCGPGGAGDLPQAYRRVCHHLALARHRCYTAGLVNRLNALVMLGHQELYGSARGTFGWGSFLTGGFARSVRGMAAPVLLATVLFGLPFAGLALAVRHNAELAYLVESPQALAHMESMYQSGQEKFGRKNAADADVQMFGFYIWNNIRINFQAFAGGILLGLGSIFFLAFNGLHAGAAGGWLTHAGLGANFWSFVVTHSALEIPSLILSGAAGLHMGWALLAPGRRTRGQALRKAVKEALPLVYGAALMDVGAASLEAFWSSSALVPQAVKFGAGGVLWTAVLTYFLFAGRRHAK